MARVRFLQVSDVHLRADSPERARALGLAFEMARKRSADAVLVCGDLFDRASDSPEHRTLVRQLIESVAPRPVVLLPGNHDAAAYGPSADFGANAVVVAETPVTRTQVCGAELLAVPYQHGRTLGECLTGTTSETRHTVLMAHGSILDATREAFAGEGEEGAFMPIFLSDLLKRSSYAALGHLHSGRNLIHRDHERLVAYAGSPVTTSRHESGPRSVLLVDFEPSVGVLEHEVIPLPTPYYEHVDVFCLPGAEGAAIEELVRQATARRQPGARVLCQLRGVALVAEPELRAAAERALTQAFAGDGSKPAANDPKDPQSCFPIVELATDTYPALAETPVALEFVERLCASTEDLEDPEVLQAALRLGLDGFLESLA